MNSGVSVVAGVTDRIRSIEQRFAPSSQPAGTQIVDQGPAFDAFGEAYQRAVAARGEAPAVPSADMAAAVNGTRARWANGSTLGTPVARTFESVTSRTNAIGGFGRMPVPGELAVFGNGRVPADHLAPIDQSGHRLHGPAAASWDALVDAAARDGIDLRITDSYRSYDQQVDLAHRKGLYSEGGLAATPGTSNHGWGLAVDADVRDPRTLEWLRRHGPEFGWVEAVPREPWHWEYRPHQV